MRVLVTGSAGFIGRNLIEYLLKNTNWQIIGMDISPQMLSPEKYGFGPNPRFTPLYGDILDRVKVFDVCSSVDSVIHLAAETHNDNSIQDPEKFVYTNIVGTFHLLEAVRNFKLRFHHISTDEVFGDLPLDARDKFRENSSYNPSSPYSASKASSDHLVRAWIRTYGIAATISNCSNNYGPFQDVEKFIPRQITNLLMGFPAKIYGNGANVRDWINVEDHCSAIVAILENGRIGETYLVGTENEYSNLEIAHSLLRILGLDESFIQFVQDRPGHDLRYCIDNSKMVRELSWSPPRRDFTKDLDCLISWYSNNIEFWQERKSHVEHHYRNLEM